MMNLIAARKPSLILFGSIQTVMWTLVWRQWQQPSLIEGPLPSHIPKGHIGRSRFQVPTGAYAHA